MRRIQPNTYNGNKQLMQCIQSFAVLELLQNSDDIYLHVPLLSDTPIVNNKAGEFALALPDVDVHQLGLIRLLLSLADRGTYIHISYRDDVSSLVLENLTHSRIAISRRTSIYPPGWITERYALSGLIHFRADRIDFHENEITVLSDPVQVEELLMKAKSAW